LLYRQLSTALLHDRYTLSYRIVSYRILPVLLSPGPFRLGSGIAGEYPQWYVRAPLKWKVPKQFRRVPA